MTLIRLGAVAWKCACATLLTLCNPAGAMAQSPLKIPQTHEEMQKLTQEPDQPCNTCGVVVAVRAEANPAAGRPANQGPAKNPNLTGGTGRELATVPLTGAGSAARGKPKPSASNPIYVVIVQYDSGAYSRVELHEEPQVRQGDRVRVIEGKVEPYRR